MLFLLAIFYFQQNRSAPFIEFAWLFDWESFALFTNKLFINYNLVLSCFASCFYFFRYYEEVACPNQRQTRNHKRSPLKVFK